MAPAREQVARKHAVDLLDELNIASLPVSPEDILSRKKIVLEERSDFPPEVFGAISYANSRFTIYISTACPTPGHRRFTLAHELGHYHIDGHIDARIQAGTEVSPSLGGHYRGRKDPLEVEADAFASELLMPRRLVAPLVARAGKELLGTALRVADAAKASLLAAAIRTVELMDGLGAVIVSHRGAVEWASFSPALWSYDFARRSWKGEWAPRASGAARLARDPGSVSRGDRADSGLLVPEWFEGAPPSYEVEEESVGLGSYGRVLTALRIPYLPDPDSLYLQRQRERDEEFREERER
jgi:Zn-dependent peptidase ImmA (M78 family)